MEHLHSIQLANKGRLILQTPDPDSVFDLFSLPNLSCIRQ